MKKFTLFLVLACVVTGGSYYYVNYFNTVAYPVVPNEVAEILVTKLSEEGVWFKEEAGSVIRFKKNDIETILRLGELASEQVLPKSRSFSPAPDLLEDAKKKLISMGIQFELKEFDGAIWIILPVEHAGKINEILLNGI